MLVSEILKASKLTLESKADVSKAITYLKALGIKVDPLPIEDEAGKITFKVNGMNGDDTFDRLDKMSKMKKLEAGQAWDSKVKNQLEGEWFDNRGTNGSRNITLNIVSEKDCTITLSYFPEDGK